VVLGVAEGGGGCDGRVRWESGMVRGDARDGNMVDWVGDVEGLCAGVGGREFESKWVVRISSTNWV